jgi:hypothetical protein
MLLCAFLTKGGAMKRGLFAVLLVMILNSSAIGFAQDNAPSLNGAWETEGYGMAFEIQNEQDIAIYEVTAVSCLSVYQGQMENST